MIWKDLERIKRRRSLRISLIITKSPWRSVTEDPDASSGIWGDFEFIDFDWGFMVGSWLLFLCKSRFHVAGALTLVLSRSRCHGAVVAEALNSFRLPSAWLARIGLASISIKT